MPIHDWTRVDAGIFHNFHHAWIFEIKRALNRGILPADYYAMAEQVAGGLGPELLTLQRNDGGAVRDPLGRESGGGGVAFADAPPRVAFHVVDEPGWYARKADAVLIHHISDHRVVAVIEIVSPGNKSSRSALQAFVRKAHELISGGVHLLVVDLFPPGTRDPEGIHPVIWDRDSSPAFQFDPTKPLTSVGYLCGDLPQAFIEPLSVGGELKPMPLFLTPETYVLVPLEASYEAAFESVPEFWRDRLQ